MLRFLLISFILLSPASVVAQETITASLDVNYAADAEEVIFLITPSVDRACIYNFYAQQRRRRLKNLPNGAISIATFQYEGEVGLRAFSLEPIKKRRRSDNRKFRRNVFLRLMIRCDGYDGPIHYSDIYKLRLKTAKSSSLKSVKAWILEAKSHMDYASGY